MPLIRPISDLRNRVQPVLSMDQAMANHIQQVLRLTQGKIYGPNGAAERLQINPNTLRSRMRKLKIPFGRFE